MRPNLPVKILSLASAGFLALSFPSSSFLSHSFSSTAFAWPFGSDEKEDFGESDYQEGGGPSYGTANSFSNTPISANYQGGAALSLFQDNFDVGYDGDFIDATGNLGYFVGTQAQGSGQASVGLQGANLGVHANFLAGAQATAGFQSILHLGLFDVETTVTGSWTTGYNASFNASFQLGGDGLTFTQGASAAPGSGPGYEVQVTVKPGPVWHAIADAVGGIYGWAANQVGSLWGWSEQGGIPPQSFVPTPNPLFGGQGWSQGSSNSSSYLPPLEKPGTNPTTQVLPDPNPPPPPVPKGPQFPSSMMKDLPDRMIVGWTPETGTVVYDGANKVTHANFPEGLSAAEVAKIIHAAQTGQWGGGSAPGGGGKGPVGGGAAGGGAGGKGGGQGQGGGKTTTTTEPSEPSEPSSEPSGPSEPAGGDEGMEVVEAEAMEPTSGADWNFAPEPEAVTDAYSNLTFIGSEYSNAMNEIYSRAEEFLPHEGIVFDPNLGKTFYKVGGEMLDSFDYTVRALEKGMSEAASRAAGKVAIARTHMEVAERNLKTQQAELERVKTENPERIGEIQDNITHYEGMLQEEKAKHHEAMGEVRTFEAALDNYVRPGQAEEPAKEPAKEKSGKEEKKTSQAPPSSDFHFIPGGDGIVYSTFLDAGTSADLQPSQGPGLDPNLTPSPAPLQFDGLLGKQFRNSSAAPGVLQSTSFSQGAAASSASSPSAAPCPD